MLTASALHESAADGTVAERLLGEFRRAAEHVPAFQTLLAEASVRAIDVRDLWTFVTLCPLLTKVNTFDRFPLTQLCVGGRLTDVAGVLTSSGHGGRFSLGLISPTESAASGCR